MPNQRDNIYAKDPRVFIKTRVGVSNGPGFIGPYNTYLLATRFPTNRCIDVSVAVVVGFRSLTLQSMPNLLLCAKLHFRDMAHQKTLNHSHPFIYPVSQRQSVTTVTNPLLQTNSIQPASQSASHRWILYVVTGWL